MATKLYCFFKKREVNQFQGCEDEFESKLKDAGEHLVLVDFYADWCPPCKIIAPKLEQFADKYADDLIIVKVNVDECEEIATSYKIVSMPTFVFIKKQKILDRISGVNTEVLQDLIIKHTNE